MKTFQLFEKDFPWRSQGLPYFGLVDCASCLVQHPIANCRTLRAFLKSRLQEALISESSNVQQKGFPLPLGDVIKQKLSREALKAVLKASTHLSTASGESKNFSPWGSKKLACGIAPSSFLCSPYRFSKMAALHQTERDVDVVKK